MVKKTETKKPNINLNKLKVTIARTVAYVSLVILASYGLRNLLKSLDDTASLVITVLVVLGLVYILSTKTEE